LRNFWERCGRIGERRPVTSTELPPLRAGVKRAEGENPGEIFREYFPG
jgi:hypothetical protein